MKEEKRRRNGAIDPRTGFEWSYEPFNPEKGLVKTTSLVVHNYYGWYREKASGVLVCERFHNLEGIVIDEIFIYDNHGCTEYNLSVFRNVKLRQYANNNPDIWIIEPQEGAEREQLVYGLMVHGTAKCDVLSYIRKRSRT